jgi:Phage tail protein (Tail_P2_I)
MKAPSVRLWELLPGLYRSRDAELPGAPLRRFIEVLGSELDRLHAAVKNLADDHFVETASPEGLKLLAELLGAQLMHDDVGKNRGVVASSVAWRRRRGTQATLERVLTSSTGWSTEVDEAFRSLLQTQDMGALVPWRGRTAVLWDPIAIADPLSRSAPEVTLPRRHEGPSSRTLGRLQGESLDAALRRSGRADAGRHAASPRTFDFGGWARPDVAVVRTARFVPLELERIELRREVSVPSFDPTRPLRGLHLDPLGRDVPLVWLQPMERPDTLETLTAIHEPPSAPLPARTAATLLTPTALAEDGDRVESAGGLELSVDGIQVVGPSRVAAPGGPLPALPLGASPVLRFADTLRPGPSDEWLIKVLATQPAGDTVLAAAVASRGAQGQLSLGPLARTQLGSATVSLRVRRLGGAGAVRSTSGQWTAIGDGARLGLPLGPVIALPGAGGTELVRPELHESSQQLRLARAEPTLAGWSPIELSGDVPAPEAGIVLVVDTASLFMLVPQRSPSGALERMALFRVEISAGSAQVTRVLQSDALSPPARRGCAAAMCNGRLYVCGGEFAGDPLGDLWSIATDGSEADFRPHLARNAQPRVGASLLTQGNELWLVGGESQPGKLASRVCSLDTTVLRQRWVNHVSLPYADGHVGVACARRSATALHVVAWANSTRARHFTLLDGAATWEAAPAELDSPNPPAPGEAVFLGEELVVVGPSPLPESEIILNASGDGVLLHLPALDLRPAELDASEALLDDESQNPGLPVNAYETFHVALDGSTFRVRDSLGPLHERVGGALHASLAARSATRPRLCVPERLEQEYFALRQHSLTRWTEPTRLRASDVIGLDPRLGRVVLPYNFSLGRLSASYRTGHSTPIGAGFLPILPALPQGWHEPEWPAPAAPTDRTSRVSVWVDPFRAGTSVMNDAVEAAIAPDLEAASLALVTETEQHPLIGVTGSHSLPPARLSSGLERGISIVATDFGGAPLIRRDASNVSLALHPSRGGWRGMGVWLRGLWLTGRLEVAMARGEVDVRWCTLGEPGALGVRVAGGNHETALTRRVLPEADLQLRLYGCRVGALQVPPWVRVIAAGCTFDAGARDAFALSAVGGSVYLRQCTIHGRVDAGELKASSCVFAGSVRVDRRDRGWIRHSILTPGGRPPRTYRTVESIPAFSSVHPTHPNYLVLAENNSQAELALGEAGLRPGAAAEHSQYLRELEQRTADFLPIGLVAHHVDRATADLNRMS